MDKSSRKRKKDNYVLEKKVKEPQVRIKARGKESRPKLGTRSSPNILPELIEKLNPQQRSAIVNMGFAGLLELKINKVPSKLTYWLLDNFNPVSSELVLGDGKSIHIDASDVERVFGFPNGSISIEKKIKSENCALLEQWQRLFDKNHNNITAGEVRERLLECSDGGDWFKRHFVVLVDSLIIGNNPCGYVSPLIMKSLEDVNNIRNLNWCQYTLNTLIVNKVRWEKKRNKKQFNGPLLFLSVLYLDRVIILCARDVPRRLPCLSFWTSDIIRKRTKKELELGGFGMGFVDNPLPIGAATESVSGSLLTIKGKTSFSKGNEEYASSLLSKLSCLATDVVDIISLLKNVPEEVTQDAQFCKVEEAARKLICSASNQCFERVAIEPVEMSESQQNEAFWNNNETIAAIEKIELALERRDEYKKLIDDAPSFSLGITQDMRNDNWDDVVHISGRIAQDAFENIAIENWTIDDLLDEKIHIVAGEIGDKVVDEVDEVQNIKEMSDVVCDKNKRIQQKARTLISPFRARQIDVSSKCNKTQLLVSKWIFDNEEAEKNEIIFKFGEFILMREEMESLKVGGYVSVAVVDIWSRILNYKEELKSTSSPLRFFSTTYPTQFTVVSPKEDLEDGRILDIFTKSFDAEIGDTTGKKIGDIHMFFFPICKDAHFFVVCFDIKRQKCHILDNSSADGTKTQKYERIPEKLRLVFSQYILSKGYPFVAHVIQNSSPVRLAMPWRDNENNTDCAIFAMRHMETYMGGGIRNWDSGLEKMNVMQIAMMRSKYCAAIALDEINEMKKKNMEEANKYRDVKKKVENI